MCLYTKQPSPKIAEENIICYKVLHRAPILEGPIYRTPYKGTVVDLKSPFEVPKEEFCLEPDLNRPIDKLEVTKGAIHTYKNPYYAAFVAQAISRRDHEHFVLVKCIIPKGTLYYEGSTRILDYSENYASYASQKIEFVEIIYNAN